MKPFQKNVLQANYGDNNEICLIFTRFWIFSRTAQIYGNLLVKTTQQFKTFQLKKSWLEITKVFFIFINRPPHYAMVATNRGGRGGRFEYIQPVKYNHSEEVQNNKMNKRMLENPQLYRAYWWHVVLRSLLEVLSIQKSSLLLHSHFSSKSVFLNELLWKINFICTKTTTFISI